MLLISEKKIDQAASRKYGTLEFLSIPAVAKPPTLSPKMLPFLVRMWKSVNYAKQLLRSRKADAVLGMGGFTSLAPVLAGHKLGLKTFVHDSNALPGKANRLTARWCSEVLVGLKAAVPFFPKRKVEVTGTPIRLELKNLPNRAEAAAKMGLDPQRSTVLVMGGSQGANRLNTLIAEAGTQLPDAVQIIHVAGPNDVERVKGLHPREGTKVLPFCEDMAAAYAVSDLVVCRSGASSLTEIAHAGLPSILIPYPFAADDHQTRNAEVFSQAGAAVLLPENGLTTDNLANRIRTIVEDLNVREGMAQAARELDVADAAARVCDAIEATIRQ